MSEYNFKKELDEHVCRVARMTTSLCDELYHRGQTHDNSKYEEPEFGGFANSRKLKEMKYMSDEYQMSLNELDETLKIHYSKNRHHPQHFTTTINEMNIVDITEMLLDWKAGTYQTKDGNLIQSIKENQKRFRINSQVIKILLNTAKRYLFIYSIEIRTKGKPTIYLYGDDAKELEKSIEEIETDDLKQIASMVLKDDRMWRILDGNRDMFIIEGAKHPISVATYLNDSIY